MVQPGDRVIVKAGTYYGRILMKTSGTASAPIIFEGEPGAIIDGSEPTSGWVTAPEIGPGVYKTTNIPYNPDAMIADSDKHIARIHDDNMQTNKWINWQSLLAKPASATFTRECNAAPFTTVPFWDGVEAYFGHLSGTTYIRFKNGDNPATRNVRSSPGPTGCFNCWPMSAGVRIEDKSYVNVKNFTIRGAQFGITIKGANALGNVIESNRIMNGFGRVFIALGAHDNVVRNNKLELNQFGSTGYVSGAHTAAAGCNPATYANPYAMGVNEHIYNIIKYTVGSSNQNNVDNGVKIDAAGPNNEIAGNEMFNGNTGVSIVNTIGKTKVHDNIIRGMPSEGIFIQNNVRDLEIYDNLLHDSNINIRAQNMNDGNRLADIYRNRIYSSLPNVGESFYFHFWPSSPPPSSYPEFYVYHNSISGGGHALGIGDAVPPGGMPATRFINNVFSSSYLYTSWVDSPFITNSSMVGAFDYNWAGGIYARGVPAWFGSNNINARDQKMWNVTTMPDFKLPAGSLAIDKGIDLSKSWTVNGVTYPAMPGMASGYFSGIAPDMGAVEFTGTTPPVFDFSLSNGGNKSVNQGSSVTNSVTATLVSGTSQSVSFSTSGLPTGATPSFSPTSCSPTCPTVLTISTLSITPAGTYTVTITGTATGGLTKITSFTLTVIGIDTQAPSIPTGFTATAISSSQINLLWIASTDNVGVAGYKVFRGGVQIATVTTGTSYSNTGLSQATTYSYTVSAYDAAGNNSAQSTAASATTPSTGAKFIIGDRIQTTAAPNLNVRATPSTSGTLLGTKLPDSRGAVIGGPTVADGFTWWNINFDNGVDGWATETFLEKPIISRFFQKDSTWNTKIPASTVINPNSANYINDIILNAPGLGMTYTEWSGPVFYARPDTTNVTVNVTDSRTVSMGWNIVPIPPEAVPAGNAASLLGQNRDGHLTIISADRKYAWTFYRAIKQTSGSWSATNIRKWDLSKDGIQSPYDYLGAQRRGYVPEFNGLITYEDIKRGSIDHTLAFHYWTGSNIGHWGIYPSEGYGGGNPPNSPWSLLEGMRLQLDPSLNLDSLPLTPAGKIVAKALQEYGAIFVENAGKGSGGFYAELLDDKPDKWGSTWAPMGIPLNKMRIVENPRTWPPVNAIKVRTKASAPVFFACTGTVPGSGTCSPFYIPSTPTRTMPAGSIGYVSSPDDQVIVSGVAWRFINFDTNDLDPTQHNHGWVRADLLEEVSPGPDTTPPSVPTGLTATAVSSSQINLSWTASTDPVVTGQATSGVAGYKVFRGGVQIATVTMGTSYSNTGLTAATTYSYTVSAYDTAAVPNNSVQSASVSATTLVTAGTFYLSPTGLDTNTGTSETSPWKTFAKAIPALSPGDTLILRDGTYTYANSGQFQANCATGGNAKNGVASAPITIKAENERRAFIQGTGAIGSGGTASPFRFVSCSWWTAEGLRIENQDNAGNIKPNADIV